MNRYLLKAGPYKEEVQSYIPMSESEVVAAAVVFMNESVDCYQTLLEGEYAPEPEPKPDPLAAARAVLAEHGEMIDDLRQSIDGITHCNTSADPKKLRLLLALADALEATP